MHMSDKSNPLAYAVAYVGYFHNLLIKSQLKCGGISTLGHFCYETFTVKTKLF